MNRKLHYKGNIIEVRGEWKEGENISGRTLFTCKEERRK